jgi:hypothetical protein
MCHNGVGEGMGEAYMPKMVDLADGLSLSHIQHCGRSNLAQRSNGILGPEEVLGTPVFQAQWRTS